VGGYWKRKKAVCTCYAQEKVCDIENMIYRSANGIYNEKTDSNYVTSACDYGDGEVETPVVYTMRKPIPMMGMVRIRLSVM
jgi:hypothetical protein